MVNDFSDTTISDILNQVRMEIAANRADKNKSTNPIIEYILTSTDGISLTDSVSNNGNTQTVSDSIQLSDSVSRTSQATATFLIDTALIDFSDVA